MIDPLPKKFAVVRPARQLIALGRLRRYRAQQRTTDYILIGQ
jgi:hypothetical protein